MASFVTTLKGRRLNPGERPGERQSGFGGSGVPGGGNGNGRDSTSQRGDAFDSVGMHSTARGLHEDAQLQAFTTGELCCELLRWGKTANSRLERAARSSAVYMLEAH